MQPGKLAWLPSPPFSLPTGDLVFLPTSRRGQNPLLATVQQPHPTVFSILFHKSGYFLREKEKATGAPSPVPQSLGWNGHKTMVWSRRAARLRGHPTESGRSLRGGAGAKQEGGFESGPGRPRSAELTAARLPCSEAANSPVPAPSGGPGGS